MIHRYGSLIPFDSLRLILRHAIPLFKHRSQFILRVGIVLFRSFRKPFQRFWQVLFSSAAVTAHEANVQLSPGFSAFRCFQVPCGGFLVVLDAPAPLALSS